MMDGNGSVTYEACVGGSKRVVKTVRGKITAKRVMTFTRVWDRSGKRVSAYRTGMMSLRLLSFQVDGGAVVVVSKPTAADVPTTRELLSL